MLPKNVISWFHIPVTDLPRAAKFYSAILGNEVKVMDFNGQAMGFFPMAGGPMGDGVGGALMPSVKGLTPSNKGTQVFLSCEGTLDAVLGRVEKAGGTIVTPKTHMGEPGYFAFIQDLDGNQVGLHSSK